MRCIKQENMIRSYPHAIYIILYITIDGLQAAIRSYASSEAIQESSNDSGHHTDPINYDGHRDACHHGPLQASTAGALCVPGDIDVHARRILVSAVRDSQYLC